MDPDESEMSMTKRQVPSIDGILERIGFGKYQIVLFFLLGMFWLADGAEVIVVSVITTVLQKAWGIDDWQVSLLGGIIFLGMIIGTLFSGWLGDVYGRRVTLIGGAICLFLTGAGSSFMPEFWSFMFTRCLTGVGIGVVIPVASTYAIEIVTPRYRGSFQIFLFLLFVLGNFLIVLLGFWLIPDLEPKHWRWLLFAASVPTLLAIVGLYFCMDESPRFLAIKNRPEIAIRNLNCITSANSRSSLTSEEESVVRSVIHVPDGPLLEKLKILLGPEYCRDTLVLSYMWWTLGFTFYGLLFILPRTLEQSTDDSEVLPDLAISTAVELPSILVSAGMVELRLLGRKRSLMVCCFFQAVAALLCASLVESQTSFVVMSSALNFGVNVSLNIVYPYTSELFPTSVRSSGFGLCSSFMRIAGCLAPSILLGLNNISLFYPYIAILGMNALAFLSGFLLKRETRGRRLTETTESM